MRTTTHLGIILLGMLLLLPSTAAQAQQPDVKAALQYLRQNHRTTGLSPKAVNDLVLTNQHTSSASGLTHFYFQQQLDGIPVYNAIVGVSVGRNGQVIHVSNRAVSDALTEKRSKARGQAAEAAVASAARALGLQITEPLRPVAKPHAQRGPFKKEVLSSGGISSDEIQAQLMYLPTEDGRLRIVWMVAIYTLDGDHFWNMAVDAATGAVLLQEDLVDHDNWDAPVSPFSASSLPLAFLPKSDAWIAQPLTSPAAGGTYRVYGWPVESPAHAGDPTADLRTLISNPADPTASPLGWHNDGVTAYTRTQGNNVHAYADIDANNVADPESDPDGTGSLTFDFPFDPSTQAPPDYRPAAVTNLFYWNNLIHDVMYRYGFTEEAGNFQTDNFGKDGAGLDYVRAEAQDGSGTNNANFGTPVDGFRPRMQMFVWTNPLPNELTVGAPINQTFAMSAAAFGPAFPVAGITATLVVGLDPADAAGPSTTDGCSPLTNAAAVSGNIAVIDRGTCPFVTKVQNAQNAGAVAVVIVNNTPGASPATLGGASGTIIIPSGMISFENGATVKAGVPATGTARNLGAVVLNRDSDFDNGVIVHEYGHGISNRLTGGRDVIGCLSNAEQMGEGWSDFYALLLTDTNTDDRGIGTYLIYQPTTGLGIRPYPYSTSLAVNPSTYATINNPSISQPHGVGSVWATMLWDMTRDLVKRYGFEPDLFTGNGGNNRSLMLVTEGLKMQPCSPGFVDGRNAILAADAALNGGANQCLIWDSFARRGLGFSADQGSPFSRFDALEAFDLPTSCSTFAMARAQVQALLDGGVLNKGQATSLLQKLQNAEQQLGKGQTTAALNLLIAFSNEVRALIKSGRLTQAQGDTLLAAAEGLSHRIQESNPSSGKNALVGADADAALPEVFAFDSNYPNPFRDRTNIRYALPEAAHVRVTVYDVVGREVARLVDNQRAAGFYEEPFDATGLPSGLYLCRIEAGAHVAVRQMLLVR